MKMTNKETNDKTGKNRDRKSSVTAGKKGKGSAKRFNRNCDDRTAKSRDISSHRGHHYDDITSNDIGWYNKAGYLFDEATRVPFDLIQGAPRSIENALAGADVRGKYVTASTTGVINGFKQYYGTSTPGIMRVDFAPTIGWSDSISSPVNRAFTSIYGDIASKTTGAMQFTQASLAMFTVSMASIAALIGVVKRCMEVSFLYSPVNYYYPVDLLTTMLGSQDAAMDVIHNRDVYRAQLNDLVFQFNNFRIPHFVSIFERQYSLCHNVYADRDDVRSEVTYFMPTGYYSYDDVNNKLTFNKIDYTDANLPQLFRAIINGLEQWRHTSDLPLINGALQRAYPDSNFVQLDALTPDSLMVPVYDRNMNWQINNMRTIPVDHASLDVTEDVVGDFLQCTPKGKMNQTLFDAYWRSWVYLNSYDGDTSPEFIMEATRLIPTIMPERFDDNTVALNYVCSEIPEYFTVYNRVTEEDVETGNKVSKLISRKLETVHVTNESNIGGFFDGLSGVAALSAWSHAPRVDVLRYVKFSAVSPDPTYVFLGTFGNIDVATALYADQLVSLNKAALQSLYWTADMSLRI